MNRVLVIAAGGLGRFVQALGALAALRLHHRGDSITLLTVTDAAILAAEARLVDEVWSDTSTGPWDWRALTDLRRRLRTAAFTHVYDLDGGACGRRAYWLTHGWGLRGRDNIAWCGPEERAVRGTQAHIYDRMAAQVRRAGVPEVPAPDLTWIARKVTEFHVPFRMTEPFALLACDPAEGRARAPDAAWDTDRWLALGEGCAAAGLRPVLLGLKPAPGLGEAISRHLPRAVDLTGQISLTDMVFLAWAAKGAVGCDNGVMHLMAVANCRAVVLYDALSDPALCGPRGHDVTILRRAHITHIPVSEVMAVLQRPG